MKPTCCSCFFLFHSHNPKIKQNHPISSTRAKTRSTRSQASVKYRGNIICIKRNTDGNTGDLKILHKKCPNKVDFPDIIFNFSKMLWGLPSTLFLTGELWPLRFICDHDLRVAHCQSSAMTFVFTQYSFCNSFKQVLKQYFNSFTIIKPTIRLAPIRSIFPMITHFLQAEPATDVHCQSTNINMLVPLLLLLLLQHCTTLPDQAIRRGRKGRISPLSQRDPSAPTSSHYFYPKILPRSASNPSSSAPSGAEQLLRFPNHMVERT